MEKKKILPAHRPHHRCGSSNTAVKAVYNHHHTVNFQTKQQHNTIYNSHAFFKQQTTNFQTKQPIQHKINQRKKKDITRPPPPPPLPLGWVITEQQTTNFQTKQAL